MTIIMLIFVTALFFGSVGTPLVRRLAIYAGFIDMPKVDRAHSEPTALMGGVAIYGAAIIALLAVTILAAYFLGNTLGLREFAAILTGASFMAAVGLWDDRRALPPRLKLAAQVAPIVLVFFMGVRVSLPILNLGIWNPVINFLITAAWILYITNAVNFLDNADGIAIMTSATTSAIFLLIAILNDQQLVSVLAAAVLGASLGFARYNLPLPRSSIFMGDSGSLFLGFLLAVLGIKIRVPVNDIQITWMTPIIVLGLPLFDTAMVFISRTRRGVSFFQGGIDHTTHRLARLGLDKLSVALTITVINGALGLVAIFVTQANLAEAYSVAAGLLVVALYALWKIEFNVSYNFRTGRTPVKVDVDSPKT